MKKNRVLLLVVTAALISFSIFFSFNVSAGKAGVGVQNVPPKYGMIRLTQVDDLIRVYITTSDYNSWEDIYTVSVTLEDYGAETAKFIFKQFEDDTSFQKINEFSESGGRNLLVDEKCSYLHSDQKDTIPQRCDLDLLFVFRISWFTSLDIVVKDRDGETATAHVDYNTEEIARNSDIIIFPGLDEPISLIIPPYLLDVIAIFLGVVGTAYLVKKRDKKIRVSYEKG